MQSLWDYACRLYQEPGTADKLLRLQDDYHLIVNMLLMMHWLGHAGKTLDEQGIADCLDSIGPLEETILKPFRQNRRAIKQQLGNGDVYRQSKQLELELEREVIRRLQACVEEKAYKISKNDVILGNLRRYITVVHKQQKAPLVIEEDLLDF